MKIAVMGAGGIGGYVGGRLAEAGEDVSFIARGRHLAALKADGLAIESPHGNAVLPAIRAVAEASEIGPVDVVLFTVKLTDAAAAARSIVPLIAAHTRIVTLQNGVDSREIIGHAVDPAHVAAGIIYLAAYIKAPGIIYNPGGVHRMVIDRMGGDPVMAAFFAACDRAVALDAVPTDDAERTLWEKFIVLTAFSGASAIARVPVGAIYEHPATLDFMRQLMREALAVAQARGLAFDDGYADHMIALFRNQPYGQKASMLVDLEAGKPLELPWLSGRVAALGERFGIPTPASSAVLAALAPYVDGPPQMEKSVAAAARA